MISPFEKAKEATLNYFNGDEIATDVFLKKYALKNELGEYVEDTPDAMHKRLAREFARIEKLYENPMSEEEIYELFKDFKWVIPQGSPMSAIGNPYKVQSSSNCFVQGTKVYTSCGVKNIEDIEIGDQVVTHKNRLKSVSQIHKNKLNDRQIFNIKCYRTPVINVTSNHEFMSISKEQLKWGHKPKFNPVSYLRTGDYIKIPNNKECGKNIDFNLSSLFGETFKYHNKTYEVEKSGNKIKFITITKNNLKKHHKHFIPQIIKADNDFAYFIGLWYGDGCIFGENSNTNVAGNRNRKSKNPSSIRGITFTFGSHENKLVSFVTDYMNKLEIPFDLNDNDKVDGTIQIVVHSPFLGYSFEKLFGRRFDGKRLHDTMHNWTKDMILSLTQGLIDSDGTITKSGDVRIVLSNKALITDIYHLLRSRGQLVGYSETETTSRLDFGRNNLFRNASNKSYNDNRVTDLLSNKTNHKIEIDGDTYIEILGKSLSQDKPKYVYTFGVEDDHSYSVEGIIAMNCFVVQSPYDSYGGVCYTDQQEVQIAKRRGGVGFDISTLRPKGTPTANAAGTSDGIEVFMERYSNSCREVAQSGRRGALLLSLSVHHPDIETFIKIKRDLKKVTGANISIRLSDEFMNAVKDNKQVELRFPVEKDAEHIVKRKVPAKELWDEIVKSARDSAEPGLLFWDNVIKNTPSDCYADVGFGSVSTNPCGEITLSMFDSCRLMVVNLFSFVKNPFTTDAFFDYENFSKITHKAQRLMDDMIDIELECIDKIIKKIELDPEPEYIKQIEVDLWHKIKDACIRGRRTGLGITALGDTLAALGIKYGSNKSIKTTEEIYKNLAVSAYESSVIMAKERGAFPVFDYNKEKDSMFIQRIINESDFLKENYKKYGRRNIALTTTAPTGSVSIMTQTTSGIEPAFMLSYTRRRKINPDDINTRVDFIDDIGDKWMEYPIYHHKYKMWMDISSLNKEEESPYHGGLANDIDWVSSVKLQASAQKWICHAISRTCNLPNDVSYETVSDIYMEAWKSGCKGFTVYRDGSRSGVLVSSENNRTTKFAENRAPKRPENLPCDIHKVNIKGETWTVLIGLMDGRPYEIFGGLSSTIEIPKKYKKGVLIKHQRKSVVSIYDLTMGNDDDKLVIKNVVKVFDNPTEGAFTRTISLALRHGAPIQFLTEQLQKDDKESDMFSFSRVIARVLKGYIIDGTSASGECPECGSDQIMYTEGCLTCPSCGFGKCG